MIKGKKNQDECSLCNCFIKDDLNPSSYKLLQFGKNETADNFSMQILQTKKQLQHLQLNV